MNRLWLLVCLLSAVPAGAQEGPVSILSNTESVRISGNIRYLVDSTGMGPDEAIKQNFSTTITDDIFHDERNSVWMKFSLLNKTASKQFIVTLDQWNEADAYLKEQTGWTHYKTGTNVHVEDRPISLHRLISFPVVMQPGEMQLILVRVRVTDPLMRYYAKMYSFHQKVEVDESGHAFNKYLGNQLMVLFVLGVVLTLFFYNLSLYYFDKQGTSLILALYFIAIGLTIANIHGITTNYILSAVSAYEMRLALHLAHLTPIIIATFLIAFCQWGRKNWEAYVLLAFIVFMLTSWILSLLTQTSMFYFPRRHVESITYLVVLSSAIFKRVPGSVSVTIAILAGTLSNYYGSFKAVFFENVSFIDPDFPYLIGILIQVAIFSVAATYRVRLLQHGVEMANEEKRLLIANQNIQLRLQVEEKTKQVWEALTELQSQKAQLEQYNITLEENAKELARQSRDIKELNVVLENLVDERTLALHRTMKDLDTFLYRTSHDLRRPLMTILGLSNLIEREREHDKISELVHLVRKTVNDLDQMLKKLIAISLCFHNDVEMTPVPLGKTIEEAVADFSKQFPGRGRIRYALPDDDSAISSNEYLVKTILFCNLENAVAYGGAGVLILIDDQHVNGRRVISITDNGPGIEPDYLPEIFDMFSRGNEKSPGNGLGLYLVKVAMEKLGGSVSITSAVDKGTTVRLTF